MKLGHPGKRAYVATDGAERQANLGSPALAVARELLPSVRAQMAAWSSRVGGGTALPTADAAARRLLEEGYRVRAGRAETAALAAADALNATGGAGGGLPLTPPPPESAGAAGAAAATASAAASAAVAAAAATAAAAKRVPEWYSLVGFNAKHNPQGAMVVEGFGPHSVCFKCLAGIPCFSLNDARRNHVAGKAVPGPIAGLGPLAVLKPAPLALLRTHFASPEGSSHASKLHSGFVPWLTGTQ